MFGELLGGHQPLAAVQEEQDNHRRDEAAGAVSVRSRSDGDLGAMSLPDFVAELKSEAAS